MSEKQDEESAGFKVSDKRRVGREPDADTAAIQEDGQPSTSQDSAPAEETPQPSPSSSKAGDPANLPPIDFSTLVLSFASSALVHLGEVENPESNAMEPNIPMARQAIDLLSMLQEKTQGNLSRDESHYLETILYDLRMRCVEACSERKKD